MAPLIVLVAGTLVFRAIGFARVRRFASWRDAVRHGLAVMFLVTAGAHFAPGMREDMAAMIPPPFTGALWIIYVTGVLEAAGAVGLMIPRFQKAAAICLILLLIGLFPANAYAAMHGVTLGGSPASPLWWRTPLQILWIALLWWSGVRQPTLRSSSTA